MLTNVTAEINELRPLLIANELRPLLIAPRQRTVRSILHSLAKERVCTMELTA